jgi:hypothetical protein
MNELVSSLAGTRAVLVLGMHRSGTSALTGTLAKLGVCLGREESALPPRPDNPRGFWENIGIFAANERLLTQIDSSWDDTSALPLDWQRHPAALRAKREIRELLESEMAGAEVWAVKDPRLCRLLPLWREMLEEMGVSISYVMCVRHPLEVARSLAARDGFSVEKGFALWLRHVQEAELSTRGAARVAVAYDDFLTDWRGQMGRICSTLNLTLPLFDSAIGDDIDAFLGKDERHHDVSLEGSTAIPSAVHRAYNALLGACLDAWEPISGFCDKVADLLAPFDAPARAESGVRLHIREAQLEEIAANFASQREWFNAVAAYWHQRREGEHAFDVLNQSLDAARKDLERMSDENKSLLQLLRNSRDQEDRLTDALALSNLHIGQLNEQRAMLDMELSKARKEMEAQRESFAELVDRHAQLEAGLAELANRNWLAKQWVNTIKGKS